jgi:hypothetical protein
MKPPYVVGFATFTGSQFYLVGNTITDDPKEATRYATDEEAQLAADTYQKLSRTPYPVFVVDTERDGAPA